MEAAHVKGLKALEIESSRLEKLLSVPVPLVNSLP